VVFEYPKADGDPYYPVPRKENAALYDKYRLLTKDLPNVYFTGRLATYKYYNMDQVVAQSLTLFRKLISANQIDRHEPEGTNKLLSGDLGRN
jgi:UDP-galactopyranose mutase